MVFVSLAYLPDIVGRMGSVAGIPRADVVGHSLFLAALLAFPAGRMLRGPLRLRGAAAVLLIGGSIAVHDLADAAQVPNRMLLWPLSQATAPLSVLIIPKSSIGELVVFLPVLAGVMFFRRARLGRFVPRSRRELMQAAALAVILLLAAVANGLRASRAADLMRARVLVEQGDFRAALDYCDRAETWPSPIQAGRLDYVRAESWLGLGERERARWFLVRSVEADPSYYWAVADLAVVTASGPEPLDQRRRLAAPWISLLQSRFAGHPALPRTLERIRSRLNAPVP